MPEGFWPDECEYFVYYLVDSVRVLPEKRFWEERHMKVRLRVCKVCDKFHVHSWRLAD